MPESMPVDAEQVYHCDRCDDDFSGTDACPVCGSLGVAAQCETHPDRSAEGRCVVCQRALCDDCAAGDGRAFLCEAHREVVVIEGWAQVYTTTNEFEAQLARDNLRAQGIDSQIYSQKDRIFTVDLGELSIVRLLVPVWEYGRATALIQEPAGEEGDMGPACAACGAPYEPGAATCGACGAPLV